ncbi:sensor histidine kinase [Oceanispirochaeta crateris]|nr:sensor histidine kinase [Oceanispirochaeta crateris]
MGGLMYGFSLNFINRTLNEQTMNSIISFHEKIHVRVSAYENILLQIQNGLKTSESLNSASRLETDNNEIYEIMYDALEGEVIKPIVHLTNLDGSRVFSTSDFPESYKAELMNKWGVFREIEGQTNDPVIYLQEMDYSREGKTIISLGSKLYDQAGSPTGYILVEMSRQVLFEEAKVFNSGLSNHMVLLDENGYTLFDSINSEMEGKFQQAKYLDLEKIGNHYPIDSLIGNSTFLNLEYRDKKLKTVTRVNVSSNIFHSFNRILTLIIVGGSLFSLLVSIILANAQARSISSPIKELISVMGEVEKGALEIRANLRNRDEIGELGKYFNQMLDRLNIYMNQVIEKQKQLRTVEIKMLQAQIKPHFIYNTLDVIKWSVKLGHQPEAISVVTNLARLLRFSIDSADEFLTIRNNIEFINSYLTIQRIKYNNSFEVITDIDEALMDYRIPRLILQPFIENSIIHGFGKTNKSDGIITITGQFNKSRSSDGNSESQFIEFRISDNGLGMTEQEIQELTFERPEHHIGIYNVDRRIKMYFGDDFGVRISSHSGGTEVVITMPKTMTGEIM